MSDAISTTPEFSPDFSSVYSPYTEEYGFNSIIFPSNAPLLCRDLNELQSILDNAQKAFSTTILTDGMVSANISDTGKITAMSIHIGGRILSVRKALLDNIAEIGFGTNLWLLFDEEVIDADTEILGDSGAELDNYLAQNEFQMELSRRKKISCTGYSDVAPASEKKSIQVIKDGKLVYSKIKLGSNQGDEIRIDLTVLSQMVEESIDDLSLDIALLYNGFAGGNATKSIETDDNGNEIETWVEEQKYINNGALMATKTSVLGGLDDYGNEVVVETLDIVGCDMIYEKTTTFKVGENGDETIETNYRAIPRSEV
jgi:hypothetical protein